MKDVPVDQFDLTMDYFVVCVGLIAGATLARERQGAETGLMPLDRERRHQPVGLHGGHRTRTSPRVAVRL